MGKEYRDEKVFGRVPKTKPYKKKQRKTNKVDMRNLRKVDLDDYRDEDDREFD